MKELTEDFGTSFNPISNITVFLDDNRSKTLVFQNAYAVVTKEGWLRVYGRENYKALLAEFNVNAWIHYEVDYPERRKIIATFSGQEEYAVTNMQIVYNFEDEE